MPLPYRIIQCYPYAQPRHPSWHCTSSTWLPSLLPTHPLLPCPLIPTSFLSTCSLVTHLFIPSSLTLSPAFSLSPTRSPVFSCVLLCSPVFSCVLLLPPPSLPPSLSSTSSSFFLLTLSLLPTCSASSFYPLLPDRSLCTPCLLSHSSTNQTARVQLMLPHKDQLSVSYLKVSLVVGGSSCTVKPDIEGEICWRLGTMIPEIGSNLRWHRWHRWWVVQCSLDRLVSKLTQGEHLDLPRVDTSRFLRFVTDVTRASHFSVVIDRGDSVQPSIDTQTILYLVRKLVADDSALKRREASKWFRQMQETQQTILTMEHAMLWTGWWWSSLVL